MSSVQNVFRIGILMLYCAMQVGSSAFGNISEHGIYSCEELQRWSKAEKHYSNEKRTSLFSLMTEESCHTAPVVTLRNVKYDSGQFSSSVATSCGHVDPVAVAFFSNFSINHNFSHFMHALIRLFCALIDAQLIVWNELTRRFMHTRPFVVWLDRDLKVPRAMMPWLLALNENTFHLSSVGTGKCRAAEKVIYGSGCVKLLPPEKWFGYPGCRAKKVS